MKKLYSSKSFLKMAGDGDALPTSSLGKINYKSHQKSLAYFSHLATVSYFYLEAKSEGGTMAQWPLLNTLLK